VLKGTGALIVGVSATHMTASLGVAQGPFDTRASHVDPWQLDAWLAIWHRLLRRPVAHCYDSPPHTSPCRWSS
jgi:hypothetical protein